MLTISCEHPYDLTKAIVWNEGRDISIRCEKCGSRVTVVAYQILIARDLALWGRAARNSMDAKPPASNLNRRLARLSAQHGSQDALASHSWTMGSPSGSST